MPPQSSGYIPTELPPDFAEQEFVAQEAEQEPIGEMARLAGVFFEPKKAFTDIARRPHWWAPFLISSLFGLLFAYSMDTRVGWETGLRTAIEMSPAAQNLTLQQIDQAVRLQATVIRYATYASPVVTLLFVFISAVVLMFLSDIILGAGIGLKRMMGIVAYGTLPNAIYSVLAVLVMYLKPPEEYNLANPVAFNLGAFLPTDTPLWLTTLGTSVDLFTIWIITLLAIGISASSRKMSTSKAFVMVLVPMLILVMLRVGAAALQG